jgi:hypothetical protein
MCKPSFLWRIVQRPILLSFHCLSHLPLFLWMRWRPEPLTSRAGKPTGKRRHVAQRSHPPGYRRMDESHACHSPHAGNCARAAEPHAVKRSKPCPHAVAFERMCALRPCLLALLGLRPDEGERKGGGRWDFERRRSKARFPFSPMSRAVIVQRGLTVIVWIGFSFHGMDVVARRAAGDRRGRQTEGATGAGSQ